MSSNIKIDSDGVIYLVDGDNNTIPVRNPDNVLVLLASNATWDEDFTLYSYFTMLKKYPKLQELDVWISDYMETFDKKKFQSLEPNKDDIKYLMITQVIEFQESELDIDTMGDLLDDGLFMPTADGLSVFDSGRIDRSNYLDNPATSTYYIVNGRKSLDEGSSYSIDFMPMDELLHCIIRMDTNVLVNKDDAKNKQYETLHYRNDNDINLFQLITEIIYELSFHGNEEDKELSLNGILESIKEIEHNELLKKENNATDTSSDNSEDSDNE